MTFEQILLQFLSGLSLGMGVYVVASGLIIVFSVLNVLNFAHGALYMVGAYTMCSLMSVLADLPGRFFISVILAATIVAIIGGIIEFFFIRRVYGQHILYQLLLSFGLIWIINDMVKIVWGTQYYNTYPPPFMSGAANIAGVFFPKYNLLIILFGAIVFVATYMFFNRTTWGALIRAISLEPEMANILGHNVKRIFLLVFMAGCFLAGIGGAVTAPIGTVMLGIDNNMILFCFVIIVIGGVGSLWGPLIGSLLLGLIQSFGILIVPKFAIGLPYILLFLVLVFRPQGLFGKNTTK